MRGRKKSADTRAAILRCASEVFSQRPYHEVLTDEISGRLLRLPFYTGLTDADLDRVIEAFVAAAR